MTRLRPFSAALATTFLGASSLVACGLSLAISDDLTAPDAEVPPASDAIAPSPSDALAPPLPDGEPPADASRPIDAEPPNDAAADVLLPDSADAGGCVTFLKEDFTVGAGALTILGSKTAVEGGRLRLLSNGNDTTDSEGAAYYNLPTDLLDFNATFTVTTGALGNIFDTADGFAFSWMERPIPGNVMLRGGNDLGLTLSGPMQRGFAAVLDIYPSSGDPRYFALNRLDNNQVRVAALANPFIGNLVGTGAVTLKYRIERRGDAYTFSVDRSGSDQNGLITRAATLGGATTAVRALMFSTAAGSARSPGIYVDDVEVQRCP